MADGADAIRRRLRRLVPVAVAATALGIGGAVTLALRSTGPAGGGAVTMPAASTRLADGARAPLDFRLGPLGGGSPVLLASLAHGRPTVVNLFASWCPTCRAELGALAAVWHSLRGRVAFVGVDTNDPAPGSARRLLAEAGAGYPVVRDGASDPLATAYGAVGLPTTFVLDASGHVRSEILGKVTRHTLEHDLAPLLATPAGTPQ